MQQTFNSLNDFALRKAELKAQLDAESQNIKQLRQTLLSKKKDTKKKGIVSFFRPSNLISTGLTAFDGAWFAWKLYKKFKIRK